MHPARLWWATRQPWKTLARGQMTGFHDRGCVSSCDSCARYKLPPASIALLVCVTLYGAPRMRLDNRNHIRHFMSSRCAKCHEVGVGSPRTLLEAMKFLLNLTRKGLGKLLITLPSYLGFASFIFLWYWCTYYVFVLGLSREQQQAPSKSPPINCNLSLQSPNSLLEAGRAVRVFLSPGSAFLISRPLYICRSTQSPCNPEWDVGCYFVVQIPMLKEIPREHLTRL